jgi:hypothetical protein
VAEGHFDRLHHLIDTDGCHCRRVGLSVLPPRPQVSRWFDNDMAATVGAIPLGGHRAE